MSSGMRLLVFLVAPAAALMAVLSHPIASLLERGKFSAADAALTGRALTAFMIGLVGFSLYLFALRGFYAVQDARTPFYVNTVENVIIVGLAFILVGRYGVVGLAIAYSAAYVISAVIAVVVLKQRFPSFPLGTVTWFSVRVAAGASWCALVAWQVSRHVGSNRPLVGSLTRIVVAGTAGAIAYLAVMFFLASLDHRGPPRREARPSRAR
jgi:putative peptidoglycan lipid II flippase